MMVFKISASLWFARYSSSMPTSGWYRLSTIRLRTVSIKHNQLGPDCAQSLVLNRYRAQSCGAQSVSSPCCISISRTNSEGLTKRNFLLSRERFSLILIICTFLVSCIRTVTNQKQAVLHFKQFFCNSCCMVLNKIIPVHRIYTKMKWKDILFEGFFWITERGSLFRNEVICSFILTIFSQDSPVQILICVSERLNLPILSCDVKSHLIERVPIILENSEA